MQKFFIRGSLRHIKHLMSFSRFGLSFLLFTWLLVNENTPGFIAQFLSVPIGVFVTSLYYSSLVSSGKSKSTLKLHLLLQLVICGTLCLANFVFANEGFSLFLIFVLMSQSSYEVYLFSRSSVLSYKIAIIVVPTQMLTCVVLVAGMLDDAGFDPVLAILLYKATEIAVLFLGLGLIRARSARPLVTREFLTARLLTSTASSALALTSPNVLLLGVFVRFKTALELTIPTIIAIRPQFPYFVGSIVFVFSYIAYSLYLQVLGFGFSSGWQLALFTLFAWATFLLGIAGQGVLNNRVRSGANLKLFEIALFGAALLTSIWIFSGSNVAFMHYFFASTIYPIINHFSDLRKMHSRDDDHE